MATATDHETQAALQAASDAEREAFWRDVPAGERMARWEARMNQELASYTTDPANRGARIFLQKLLREHDRHPLDGVEVSARALYTIFFDRDGKGSIAGFVRRIFLTTTREEREANFGLIANLARIYGQESSPMALRLLWERHAATVLGRDLETGEEVFLPQSARPHLFEIGNTGSGKSTLFKNMIADDLRNGRGVAVIDPHDGVLVKAVLGLVPNDRLNKVAFLDLTDTAAPFGLNIFACEEPGSITQAGQVVSFVMSLFEALVGVGLANAPQLSMVLRNISRVLVEQGLTMAEIPLLLGDETVRERLTATLRNPQVKRFWEEYNRRTARERAELTASTANKLDAFLSDPLVANIVSQRTTPPWRRLMDERRIVLIALSRQHEEASRLVGTAILGQLLMASFSRMGSDDCPVFHVYADEWQTLVTSQFATWIHEARKGHVVLHMANQSLSQLTEVNRQAALSAGALVVFRVGAGEDSKTLAASLDHRPAPVLRAPVSDVMGHLVRRGHTNPVVAQFVADYLMPLQALIRKVGVDQHEFPFGCTMIHLSHLIDGQLLVNECLYACMRTGRGDGFIPPLALLILGGAADERSTYVFFHHIKNSVLNGYVVEGFYESANRFGRAGFLANEQKALEHLKQDARTSVWDRLTPSTLVERAASFLRMLRSLREVMTILARQPILVDTGEQPQLFQPRSYADAAAAIANDLAHLEPFTARVKLHSGEHLMKTNPAPQGVSGAELAARLQTVKERMLALGCRYYREVEKEVVERHAWLRHTPDEPPPTRTRVRRTG
jgi:hypothetical protein